MECLSITLTYDFVSKKIKLTWKDILFAIEQKFLSPEAAIKHASIELSQNEKFSQQLIDLAYLNKDEPVYTYLKELADQESNYDEKTISERWLYLVLDWVFDHKDGYADPLDLIEQIYTDFDYPELIKDLVRYMPSNEPDLGTIELNEARIYKKWKDYLDSQKKRFFEMENS